MGKVREANLIKDNADTNEHPDGGTFGILPMSFDDAKRYSELVTKEVFVRDRNAIVFTPGKNRNPVTKRKVEIDDLIEWAITRLRYTRDFVIEGRYVDLEIAVRGDWAGKWCFFDRGRLVNGEWVFVPDPSAEPVGRRLQFGSKTFTADDMLRHILTMPATSDVTRVVWVDSEGRRVDEDDPEFDDKAVRTKEVTRSETEGYFFWVTRTAAKLTSEQTQVVRGDSSGAPSGSSDLSSAVTTTETLAETE